MDVECAEHSIIEAWLKTGVGRLVDQVAWESKMLANENSSAGRTDDESTLQLLTNFDEKFEDLTKILNESRKFENLVVEKNRTCRSRQALFYEYLVSAIGVDTAD